MPKTENEKVYQLTESQIGSLILSFAWTCYQFDLTVPEGLSRFKQLKKSLKNKKSNSDALNLFLDTKNVMAHAFMKKAISEGIIKPINKEDKNNECS